MWFSLDSRSGTPLHLQLKEQMRLAVATGVLRPDEQLPTVRDLAAELRVNPNTVARVYRELQAEGLLVARQGSGTFVAPEALGVADQQAAGLVRQRMMSVVALGRSVGLSWAQLRERFAEVTREAEAAGVIGRDEQPSTERTPDD